MQLSEIKSIIYFHYVKDIRRYLYDFELYLKDSSLYGFQGVIQPVSDEVEPNIARFHIIKEYNDKVLNLIISQVSITIFFQYKNIIFDKIDNELDVVEKINKKIKSFFKSNIENFLINFETMIVSTNIIYKNPNDIKIANVAVQNDEIRKRTSVEINDEIFFIEEINVFKTYKIQDSSQLFGFYKNSKDNFIGWNVVFVKEVNNRLAYNNDKNKQFDFENAKELILDSYRKGSKNV